jgi:hypothetical protein
VGRGGAFLLVSPLLGPLPARSSQGEDGELDAALQCRRRLKSALDVSHRAEIVAPVSQLKNFYALLLAGLAAVLTLGSACGADKPAAVFEGKETLLRPEGYRQWVFVGSSIGLRYNQEPEKPAANNSQHFNNIYINPSAFREFARTGKFPEGTVFILEVASAETKVEPGLQGSYQKDFIALEAAVKDSKRFRDGWAYFSFDDGKDKQKDKATPFPRSACFDCHHQKAATDHVFTQFYPVLRTLPRK